MIFFTSDLHFWHRGIVHLRPWAKDVEHMNRKIIDEWNDIVRPTDTVYVLGDISFAGITRTLEVTSQLKGFIHVIPGNHDSPKLLNKLGWTVEPPIKRIDVAHEGNNYHVELCHYPLLSWNGMHHGALHLHGHCHGNLVDDRISRRLDVSVDNIYKNHKGNTILFLHEVIDFLKDRPGYYPDHHQPQ